MRRAREWFNGLTEAGKVALIVAVITTVGGGGFGVVSAVIPLLADGGGDKHDDGTPKKTAPGDASSGHRSADAKPDTPPTFLPGCSTFPGLWISKKEIPPGVGFDSAKERIDFADLDGDGFDDYLVVNGETGAVKAWSNHGTGHDDKFDWGPGGQITSGAGFDKAKERIDFADINGDGRDDYLVVNGETGELKAWKNVEGDHVGPPNWTVGTRISRGMEGHARIVFADIDGDRRDDYLMVDTASGAVQAWLNRDSNHDRQPDWKHLNQVISVSLDGGDSPSFHNIDCDRRADYLVGTEAGAVKAWPNGGGPSHGKFAWKKAKEIANGGGFDSAKERLDFADLDGDGRDDYLEINRETGAVRPLVNNGGDPA
ncbi:FG-GAP repeat domain-containing protein [Streptomyces sp. NPDC048644]|uniref:FG-GAP repeat domain-containing protein n=1 Tax=Streptomyces sp. NPDC048644 TaxID=3365582 RepID=UPI00371C70BB